MRGSSRWCSMPATSWARATKRKAQTDFLLEQTGTFGYDAIGLGERDLNYGYAYLKEAMAKFGLPYTSANVRFADTGELVVPEFLIVTRGGIRFGICSVLDPAEKIISMAANEREYSVDDPVATLRALLPRLREQCDTVVLLSHLGDRGTETLVREVQGIDVAVVGHSFRTFNREKIVDNTIMLSAVYDGRVIGRADVNVNPANGELMSVQVNITSLEDTVPDDPTMLAAVEGFLKSVEEERVAQRAAFPRNLGSEQESFLGNNNCKACHTGIYNEWRQTDHSRAYTALRASSMQSEPECLACHTTGYRHYNGFDEEQRSNLSQVQCEACHGYGTEHARDGKMLDAARESCTMCHDNAARPCYDESRDAPFDYDTFWQKIAH
ncbi:MAG: multiheme c-type cytochrome [Candidatus Krumholzibacteriia bacterium]